MPDDDDAKLHVLEALEVPYDKDGYPCARSACGETRGYGGASISKYPSGATDFIAYPFFLLVKTTKICPTCLEKTIAAVKVGLSR